METKAAKTTLQDQLNLAILENAKVRSIILAVVVILIVIGFVINGLILGNVFDRGMNDLTYIYAGTGLLVFLSARGFVFSRMLPRIYKKNGELPLWLRYGNTFLEISIPSLTIFMFGTQNNPFLALIVPIVSIYFVFILLSTLELDWKISVFAGLVSAVQYVGIAYYYIHKKDPHESFIILDYPIFYIGKGMIMLVTGVTAGFVGEQIKKSFIKYYKKKEETVKIQKLFGQQVSQAIAEEFLKGDFKIISRKRNASIMFLDIRGFTPLTENMTPEEIIDYQNKVFPFMFEVVQQNHGIINQLMGDGFMATFGAPVSFENDCLNAVRAAIEILEMLDKRNSSGELANTRIGIGIHYGEVVTGNVGTELRQQYSITGNTVIVASRIEQLNKTYGTNILISKSVYQQVIKEGIAGNLLGEVHIKGLKQPVEIYQIA